MMIHKVATVYDLDVKTLPAEFRSVLTRQEVKALRAGPEYFATLAGPDAPAWLQKVLVECSESEVTLEFDAWGDRPWMPYFRFSWQGGPAISLPRTKKMRSDVPAFLRRVYSVIRSFKENGFDMAGGLMAASSLDLISNSGMWVSPDGPVDPKTAVPFLETFTGNYLCYLTDGGGAWLESCEFRRVKNLEREVARYFEALIKGTRI